MKKLLSSLSLALIATSSFARGGQLSTAQLTSYVLQAATNSPMSNYLNYHVEGACFWLHCRHVWCSINTTLRLNQFQPDAVISVFDRYGDNPWDVGNKVIDPVANVLGRNQMRMITGYEADNGEAGPIQNHDMFKKFKEVEVVGDPALGVFRGLGEAMLPDVANPLVPYYVSLSDAELWHDPTIENLHYPMYLLPGVRQEGGLTDDWGSVFPRIGYITQPGDYKASAVLALRAADIVANTGQLHVYHYMESHSCGDHCNIWPSHENDSQNVEFQEVYPTPTTTNTNPFGSNDLGQIQEYNQSDYEKGNGDYVFVMWRHYEGCVPGDGKFIGET